MKGEVVKQIFSFAFTELIYHNTISHLGLAFKGTLIFLKQSLSLQFIRYEVAMHLAKTLILKCNTESHNFLYARQEKNTSHLSGLKAVLL